MSEPGKLVVISGPSGVGKSTLIARLVRNARVRLAVSATTRSPRPGEVDGVHYRFLAKAEFLELRDRGGLLESAEVHGNFYGTPETEVMPWLGRGYTVILDIDTQGYRAIKNRMLATGIFLAPPSVENLEERLRQRGTESDEKLKKRLENGRVEMAAVGEYDHVVVNDDVERAAGEIEHILRKS